jgi:hypothetical protein
LRRAFVRQRGVRKRAMNIPILDVAQGVEEERQRVEVAIADGREEAGLGGLIAKTGERHVGSERHRHDRAPDEHFGRLSGAALAQLVQRRDAVLAGDVAQQQDGAAGMVAAEHGRRKRLADGGVAQRVGAEFVERHGGAPRDVAGLVGQRRGEVGRRIGASGEAEKGDGVAAHVLVVVAEVGGDGRDDRGAGVLEAARRGGVAGPHGGEGLVDPLADRLVCHVRAPVVRGLRKRRARRRCSEKEPGGKPCHAAERRPAHGFIIAAIALLMRLFVRLGDINRSRPFAVCSRWPR